MQMGTCIATVNDLMNRNVCGKHLGINPAPYPEKFRATP